MEQIGHKRQLAAIMFTDIVGYTALMGDEENKAFSLLEKNRQLQKPLIESYGGKWIKELGDGVLATFSTVSDAVYCAIAIQQESKGIPDLNLRIGIHQGEVVFKDGDVFGDGVNIASRIEALAASGGISISETVKVNIQNKQGVQTVFVGEERLKNVKDPVKIYAIEAQSVDLPERVDDSQEAPAESKSSNKGIYLVLALILIAVLGYWSYAKFYQAPIAEAEDVTIAVLAFDDQSPNGDQEWLGDGMADQILNVLANVKGLQVTGKTSSFSFKGKGLTTKFIGETLNVGAVLEGSVSKIGGKLRITAQLIDVKTDAHIWSKKYDRDDADMFAIIDEVAQSIAASLRSELSLADLQEIKAGYTVDPEAYEYYLKGFHLHWDNYVPTHDSAYFELSEKMFIKALTIDSTYVEAYAGLADLYWSNSFGPYYDEQRRLIYRNKRDSVTDIGYKINPGSAYILLSKGSRFEDPGRINLDSAFYYYKTAQDIDPNNSSINIAIADLLSKIGLFERAIALQKKILSTDPLDVYVRKNMAWALERNGNFDMALEEFNKILEIDPNDRSALNGLVFIALFHEKNFKKARRLIAKYQQLYPEQENIGHKVWILALDGKNKEALSLNKGFLTYSLLDMKGEALNLIDSLIKLNINNNILAYNSLKNSKVYDAIRDEPGFEEILANAKKEYEEREAKYGHLFDEE